MQPTIELRGQSEWMHPIYVGEGLIDDRGLWDRLIRGFAKIAVVTDEHVASAVGPRMRKALGDRIAVETVLPAGEAAKNRENKIALETAWLRGGLGRDAAVVALGGGVVGDLAGFAAATYLRGIPVIQVPTSLVAMVDSSIGGKTGIDVPEGKNLIGAFHPPLAIVADIACLDSLPDEELRCGLAEAVKHAIIADVTLAEFIDASLAAIFRRDRDTLVELVRRNVKIKAAVVMADEREGDMRQVLNFGHTVGHAIERLCRYELSHGRAVALGTVAELRLAVDIRGFPADAIGLVRELLRKIGLPVAIADSRVTGAGILEAAQTDKKSRDGQIRFALPERMGGFAPDKTYGYAMPVDRDAVLRALADILSGQS